VTCDDFWAAMHDANEGHAGQAALPALKRWYSQAGTPEVTVTPTYDSAARTLTLACVQRTPPTPGQANKQPVLVPIAVGLVGADGRDLPLTVDGRAEPSTTAVLCLTQEAQAFVFSDVPAGAVPSVLRGFSAPVRLTVVGQTDAHLTHLLANDSDAFNRYEAGQVLGRNALLAFYDVALAQAAERKPMQGLALPASLVEAFRSLLGDAALDGAIVARSIALPAEVEIVDALAARGVGVDPVVVHRVRAWAVAQLAARLRPQLEAAMARAEAEIAAAEAAGGGFSADFQSAARRALRNRCLHMLSCLDEPEAAAAAPGLVLERYRAATNMTDEVAALGALVELPGAAREDALAAFAGKFADEPLVMLKWLALQAGSPSSASVEGMRALMKHASFAITNPNCCYSLFGPFAGTPAFHAADGSGYSFLGEVVRQLDAVNPQVASRIVSAFSKLGQYDTARRAMMLKELESLAAHPGLSENVGEIVARSIASAKAKA
jgi:aminopeptidase N